MCMGSSVLNNSVIAHAHGLCKTFRAHLQCDLIFSNPSASPRLLAVLKSSLYKSIFKVLPAIHAKLCQMVQGGSFGLCCFVIECMQRTVKEMVSKRQKKPQTKCTRSLGMLKRMTSPELWIVRVFQYVWYLKRGQMCVRPKG